MKNVDAWAATIFALPCMQKVYGNVQMCAKPMKPVVTVEKKAEVKKAAPAPKKEKVVEEKVLDNV